MAFLPYPRHPPRGCTCLKCTNQANRAYPPTEFTDFTETNGVEEPPTDFTDAHRWLGCVWFSHRIHGFHRNEWQRRASPGFHRCPQMVRLRKVLWLLWEDSLVAAWVWQGCHTLLICAHPCNLWEALLRQKLLWEDSLVAAWVWQDAIPS